jgi:hypothetical protein
VFLVGIEVAFFTVNSGTRQMKTTLFVMLILCSAAAFGQSTLSSQPQMVQPPSHPQHGQVHAMATENALIGGSSISYAQGEIPLWELGEPVVQPSLGDIARAYREAKQNVKKARFVLEKQGSKKGS